MKNEFKMIAKTLMGLEEVLGKEIEDIGGKDIEIINRAVSFTGDMETLYRANYTCRTAIAILKPIAEFEANNENELYDQIYQIRWEHILDVDCRFVIDPAVNSKIFRHSKYAALKSKDAIVDRFRKLFNQRPTIDLDDPDYYLGLHIYENKVTVLLNSSGESLHKRGYRQMVGLAPINEVLAAGLIKLSGWQCDSHFFDPMCGSGTLLIEAAMLANNIPAQYYRRKYAFKKWKEYNIAEWKRVIEQEDRKMKEFEYEIWGSDMSENAIDSARENIKFAKLHLDIQLFNKPFKNQDPPEGKCMVITNPPYGERLKGDWLNELYENIGARLKHDYGQDKTVWLISADFEAIKHIGLKPSKKIPLMNGALDCRFLKYELYDGSKKASKQPTIVE